MIKKPNYLTVGWAMSGLKADEPKLSSMLILRVSWNNENVRFVDLNYVQANSR